MVVVEEVEEEDQGAAVAAVSAWIFNNIVLVS